MADNKTVRKIFSLSDYRKKQLVGEIPERTRPTYREYGYFGGGTPAPGISTVDRIDYSNDTATASRRSDLQVTRYLNSGTGNSNFGYIIGGSGKSSVERIDYSNETSSFSGILNESTAYAAAMGNSNFGYLTAGYVGASKSYVQRIDYSNDLVKASFRGPLVYRRYSHGSTGNANYGWSISGYSPPAAGTPWTDRIDYSNDLVISLQRGGVLQSMLRTTATGNSNFGYISGHQPGKSIVTRIEYANDLQTTKNRGPLNSSLAGRVATGDSNFGYFGGGYAPSPAISFSIVERIDYANDTVVSSTRGPLSRSSSFAAATSSHSFGGTPNSSFASNFTFPTVPNAGYFGGGTDGTNDLASIDKVDYANDTATASVRSALSVAKNSLSAIGNGSFGYFAGGGSPGSTTVERIEYSSDTQNTSIRTNLQNILSQSASVGNFNFGYFAGAISNIQRIDYSNDNTSIVGNIDDSRSFNTATSTRNFGYFSGGDIPEVSIIQRMNFSNDTANALFRTNHAFNRRQHGGVGNETYGYYGGGGTSIGILPVVERLDYANDTTQPITRGPLSLPKRNYLGYTGSQNFGYFAGGDVPGPTYFSTIDRINYSNDTAIAQVRGPLPVAKSSGAATSPLAYGGAPIYFTNPLPQVFQDQIEFDDSNTLDLPFKRVLGSFGYFGGGNGPRSTVDRIDYSNDTATASVRGPLSDTNRRAVAATGNSNFGYFASGGGGGQPQTSTIERIDYSNDIVLGNRRNVLFTGGRMAAVSSNNFAYFGGVVSSVYRLDYANDTNNLIITTNLSSSRDFLAATGNSNFGYFGGGRSTTSTVDRIDYSNDTATASVRGPLSLARYTLAATGNSNFGYFGGGIPGTSRIDRIDYSNDTATASVRGPLSGAISELAATGNSNFGYFGGGTPGTSRIDRIDYSNDTAQASTRGSLSLARSLLAATTNARNS